MDALVEGLMEELNCETVFTIPLFGGIPVYESVVVTWIIMAVVFLLCILLSRNLSVENPSRRQVVVETAIKGLNDFFTETVGEKRKGIHSISVSNCYLHRNCEPDRTAWFQATN